MKISVAIAILFVISVLNNTSQAQFYQMSSNSYMTGYGQVYGSFGYAMATQNLYNTIQMNLQKSMARAAMVKQWGEKKVRETELRLERERAAGKTSSAKSAPAANEYKVDIPAVPKYYGKYTPVASVNMSKTISDMLSEKPDERAQLKQVIDVVNSVYTDEAAKYGFQNNIAGGMTFFMLMMATVYHDSAEPSDELTKAVYQAVNESIDAVPDFAKATNKDKHQMNDMFVGLSAMPVAVYMEGKENGNKETLQLAKVWAGEMIKLVLKIEPDKLKFDNAAMTIQK